MFASAVRINILCFFNGSQRRERECLCFTALKNRRTMCSRQHAYFAGDWAQIAVTATVHAFLFFQNTGAKRLLFDEIECLGDRKRIGLGEFFENRRLYLRSQSVDRFSARTFTFSAQRLFESIAGNLTGDIHHLLIHGEQLNVALWFTHSRGQIFLGLNHLTRIPMRELECLCKFSFRHFLCRALDHDHIVFSAYVNKVEIALGALVMRRVGNELAVNATNAHRANRACKRNVRNRQRSGCAIDRENVGIVLPVGAEQDRYDLRIVKVSLRKEWPQRPIDHSRSKRFLLARTAFTFEIAAREFSDGSRFLAVINCQREVILTFFDLYGRNRADKHDGVTTCNDDCAIGELGDFAGFDRYFIAADFGGDLLLHDYFPGFAVPGGHPDCRF